MNQNNGKHIIKRYGIKAFNNLFVRFSDLTEFHPKVKELSKKSKMIPDVPYSKDKLREHLLNIYIPKETDAPHPILIYLHGGAFKTCSKETHRACGKIYSSQGFLVFSFNYRLAPEYPFPAAFDDACNAYKWVVENAIQYQGDLNRLSIAGDSAGANLALSLVVSSCIKRNEPQAKSVWDTKTTPVSVLLHSGLLQVSDPERLSRTKQARSLIIGDYSMRIIRGICEDYLGKKPDPRNSLLAFADPLKIIESTNKTDRKLPAIYAAAGTSDILCNDTERLEKALQALRADYKIKYYKNEGHVFHFQFWRKNSTKIWKESIEFLLKNTQQ